MAYTNHMTVDGIRKELRDNEAVSFVQTQTLTDAQKLKARENIGAADDGDVSELKSQIEELAENGFCTSSITDSYYNLSSGMINNPVAEKISNSIIESYTTGYVAIPKEEIPSEICYDNTKYKVNTLFGKNDYLVSNTYTSWQTTSPVVYVEPDDYDTLYINVRKLSGNYSSNELSNALYKNDIQKNGQLVTKEYLAQFKPNGRKCIYPDGFDSRIKPNIYFNGKYYADIDASDYKISGTGDVWVSTNGNDTTGDGTKSNPFLTIEKAKTSGAVNIHLKPGTYMQGANFGNSVDFSGRNVLCEEKAVLQGDSSGHYTYTSGSAYFENIVFKHGDTSTNPAFIAFCTASNKVACFVNCEFIGGENGIHLTGIDAIVKNCVAHGAVRDGFNYHKGTSGGVTFVPNVLEIDCVAYDNGSNAGGDSCNGSTAHDGTKIIRINGEYYSCHGGVIAEIGLADGEPTISVNYGVLAHDSTGTGTYKASFWASINTQMYLYDCMSYGGDYDISAINDAKVVSWRLTTGRDNPSVNAASTATVIQH